ncbi:hypothetical protein KM043_016758 [Ampulex compressa]|nr:hypothetical protein KM043_016758 [Ampulex compressa]
MHIPASLKSPSAGGSSWPRPRRAGFGGRQPGSEPRYAAEVEDEKEEPEGGGSTLLLEGLHGQFRFDVPSPPFQPSEQLHNPLTWSSTYCILYAPWEGAATHAGIFVPEYDAGSCVFAPVCRPLPSSRRPVSGSRARSHVQT